MSLTAGVSGFDFAHPEAAHSDVVKIGEEPLDDRGWRSGQAARRTLAARL